MPSPQPVIKKIHNELINYNIDIILKDLNYAIEEYGTAFGKSMLYTAVTKIKLLKKEDK